MFYTKISYSVSKNAGKKDVDFRRTGRLAVCGKIAKPRSKPGRREVFSATQIPGSVKVKVSFNSS